MPCCTVYRHFFYTKFTNNPLLKALKALLIYPIMDGLNPDHVAEIYVWCWKAKEKKQSEDAAQNGFFTVFHVGFQRCESLTGREVEQNSPFGSFSHRNSDSNECNQLVETQQSGIISLSGGFAEDLSGDDSDVETQQQWNIEVINSTSTQPSIETLQNEQITGWNIGKIVHEKLTPSEIEIVVKSGPQPHPRMTSTNLCFQFPFWITNNKMVMLLTEIGLSGVKLKMHCFVFHVGCKPFKVTYPV